MFQVSSFLITSHVFIYFVICPSHKFAPSIYLCFYNILTMCSKLSSNELLIQSLIWCCDHIVTHCVYWLSLVKCHYNIILMTDQHFIST
jgi:hypothetical protein